MQTIPELCEKLRKHLESFKTMIKNNFLIIEHLIDQIEDAALGDNDSG